MTVQFIANKTYSTRSIGDHDCVFSYKVVKRTEKTVTIKDLTFGKTSRRTVKVFDGVETIFPEGYYSMCPVLRASSLA